MKYFEVFWRSYGETYVKTFSHTEESYMNNFIRDLQERLNVDYIEKVTHESISYMNNRMRSQSCGVVTRKYREPPSRISYPRGYFFVNRAKRVFYLTYNLQKKVLTSSLSRAIIYIENEKGSCET